MIIDIIRCPRGEHKYVVIKNEEGEVIVFADDISHFPSRNDLLEHYECEAGLDAQCLGGGVISLDYKSKVILIREDGEESVSAPARAEIILALKWAYPEFNVTNG